MMLDDQVCQDYMECLLFTGDVMAAYDCCKILKNFRHIDPWVKTAQVLSD